MGRAAYRPSRLGVIAAAACAAVRAIPKMLIARPCLAVAHGLFTTVAAADCVRDYEVAVVSLGYATFYDEGGQLAGYAIDQIRELERRSGCKLIVTAYPGQRAKVLAQHGLVAMMPFSGKPPKVEPDRLWIGMTRIRMDLVLNKAVVGEGASLNAVLANPEVTVGLVRGLNYGPDIDALLAPLPANRIDISDSIDALVRKFAAGRVGATPGFSIIYRQWANDARLNDRIWVIPIHTAAPMPGGWTFWTSNIAPEDVKLLTGALRARRDDGTDQKLLARYVGSRDAAAFTFPAD